MHNRRMADKAPVLVSGYSRSGGTLVVTILDAHSEIAMSYELYPDMLRALNKAPLKIGFLGKRKILRTAGMLERSESMKQAAKRIKDRELRTFLLRCVRGGLDTVSVAQLLRRHIAEGLLFSTSRERLRFIEQCAEEKMMRQNKSRWGLKCTSRFEDYVDMWPQACFINVIRDGRDVLASQMNTGSFVRDPAQIARGWVDTHRRFRELGRSGRTSTFEIYYEKLVRDPEGEVRRMCEFLGVSFETSMLAFYQKDLTIYSNPAGHLSLDRISVPVDDSRVGRWSADVSDGDLEKFCAVAGETMVELGYMDNTDAYRS
ncbi:MAG: sulfotransferase [Nitrospiraceae bacterium]|nr:MAG: sulfotransferase [Nitrospiraceae bacterium]